MSVFQIFNRKQQVIAKLTSARGELEDAIRIGAPAARYDSVVLPDAKRDRAKLIVRELEELIRELEETQ